MKAIDVIRQLINVLPNHTDLLADKVSIDSAQKIGNQILITTTEQHNIQPDDEDKAVFVKDVSIPFEVASLSRAGEIATLVFVDNHDLTYEPGKTITIKDSDVAEYNSTFDLIDVPNRKTVKIQVPSTLPATANGATVIDVERFDQSFNGVYRVEDVPGLDQIVVSSTSDIDANAADGTLHTSIRISGAATVERAIEAYTAQSLDKGWLFVVLGDTDASRSRTNKTDLISNPQKSGFFRQNVSEKVAMYFIANARKSKAGRELRDEMVDLAWAINKSTLFKKFPTPFYAETSDPLMMTEHGIESYSGALYVHRFTFECQTEITYKDTVGSDDSVALRNIVGSIDPNTGSQVVDLSVDLDSEEL